MQPEYSLHELCAALGVSRSGYQRWATVAPGARAKRDADLPALLRQGQEGSRGTTVSRDCSPGWPGKVMRADTLEPCACCGPPAWASRDEKNFVR